MDDERMRRQTHDCVQRTYLDIVDGCLVDLTSTFERDRPLCHGPMGRESGTSVRETYVDRMRAR